ncbi:MAG TPA: phosphatase PAP2 family protein [Puia sp.]|jgi:membrane-associated phospholipid phosphatase
MSVFRSIFTDNRRFFLSFLFFFGVGLIFLLTEGKATTFIYLNPLHYSTLDTLFMWVTFLGDGLFTVLVCVLFLLMRRWSPAIQVITAFLLSALVSQILKNIFSMPRPKQFFPPGQYAYFIPGVTHVGFASFPSGHSTTIFALATLLALFEKNKKWNIAYLFGAVAVGYSRIYLGQHFLGDVLMGSVIGILTAVGVYWLFAKKFRSLDRFN